MDSNFFKHACVLILVCVAGCGAAPSPYTQSQSQSLDTALGEVWCYDDEECGADGFCDHSRPGHASCRPKREPGAQCFGDDQCASGICGVGKKCLSPAGFGDPCNVHSPYDDDCVAGYCFDGICGPRRTLGTSCDGYPRFGPCVDGLVCDEETLTCSPRRSVGDPCRDDLECASGYCSQQRCVPRARIGELCDEDYDCLVGFCDNNGRPGSGRCRVALEPGETCDPLRDQCTFSQCDSRTLQCPTPREDGKPCERSSQCLSGLCNLGKTCGLVTHGECQADEDCVSGICHRRGPDVWQKGYCGDPFPPGSECDRTYECAFGTRCIEGKCLGKDAVAAVCAARRNR